MIAWYDSKDYSARLKVVMLDEHGNLRTCERESAGALDTNG